MDFTINGQLVSDDPQANFANLTVEVFYRLGGQIIKSDKMPAGANGDFKFAFSDALLANATAANPVEVFFQIYRANALLPSRGGIDRLEAKSYQIEIAIDLPAEGDNTPPDAESYCVAGRVTFADGKVASGLSVLAFDRDLRSEQQLGQASADAKGQYQILYTPDQFRRAEKQAADLIVRVHDANGSQLVKSTTLFNAPREATVDLVIPSAVPSEFERATSGAKDLMEPEAVSWSQLIEDDKHQDLTFLSNELELDPQRVAWLIIAHRFAERTKMDPAAFYGWFRFGLPAQLPPLLLQDPGTLRRALTEMAADNVIPARFGKDDVIDATLAELKQIRIQESLREPGEGDKPSPMAGLARLVLKERPKQEAFLRLLVEYEGARPGLWEAVRNTPELADDAENLEFVVQTGALVGEHLPLVEALQRLKGAGDLGGVRDLVRFDEAGWLAVLKQPSGTAIVGAPDGVAGEGDEQLKNYSSLLTRAVERSFPTAFVAERLRNDDVEDKEEVVAFLDAHRETFDITGTRLKTFLAKHPRAFDLVPTDKRAAVAGKVKAMQRIYRVAPKYQAAQALLKDGLNSAHAIARTSRTLFARKYGHAQALGDRETAERVHARARNAQKFAFILASDDGMREARAAVEAEDERAISAADDDMHSISLAITGEGSTAMAERPDWHWLFGSIEICECEHCRSVHGPAAYLMDLLRFLEQRELVDHGSISALDILFGWRSDGATPDSRRQDIGDIELTCENTNTLLPYVDLAIEVLEDHVAQPPAFAPRDLPIARAVELDMAQINPIKEAFAAAGYELGDTAAIEIRARGKSWRIHDRAFSYALRLEGAGTVDERIQVSARSRQTVGTAEELAAFPQYLNPRAYAKLKTSVFPMRLPFDLNCAEARAYLEHLGVSRHALMEAFSPGDASLHWRDGTIAREHLGLTMGEADLIVGTTAEDPEIATPGVWNLWGFPDEALSATNRIPDPHPSGAGGSWIESGNWKTVLTGRVDVFLQQADIGYKELLALVGTYFVNPLESDGERSIHVVGAPLDTCETEHLVLEGMNEDAILRAQRFIRLWHALGWSMHDVDRVLTAVGVNHLSPGIAFGAIGVSPLTDEFLALLSQFKRLRERLKLSLERMLSFWADIDHAHYVDHDAPGQPARVTMYERLFRGRALGGPLDSQFPEDPRELRGSMTALEGSIAAALEVAASDLKLLREHAGVIAPIGTPPAADDALTLPHLSALHRHATLAKALGLATADYLIAIELAGDPFASPAATLAFVSLADAVNSGPLGWRDIDRLARPRSTEPSAEEAKNAWVTTSLEALRADLKRIASENTFHELGDSDPTADRDGSLLRGKLALLNWDAGLIDNIVAVLIGSVTTGELGETPLRFLQRNLRSFSVERVGASLRPEVAIEAPPAYRDRLYYDLDDETLYFRGTMLGKEREELIAYAVELGADTAYTTAVVALYDAADLPVTDRPFMAPADFAPPVFPETEIRDRSAVVLRKLLPYLQAELSRQAVFQAVAAALELDVPIVRSLLTESLTWRRPDEPLLDAYLDAAFVSSHTDLAVTRSAWPQQFEGLLLLGQIAIVLKGFKCSERAARWLFRYAAAADWPDLKALPLAAVESAAFSMQSWQRLVELFELRERTPHGEDMLDELLAIANLEEAGLPAADADSAKRIYVDALIRWTEWSLTDMTVLIGDRLTTPRSAFSNCAFRKTFAAQMLCCGFVRLWQRRGALALQRLSA